MIRPDGFPAEAAAREPKHPSHGKILIDLWITEASIAHVLPVDATQDRREFKYLLPAAEAEAFRAFIGTRMPLDRGAEGGYPVISEYFDTGDRHSYWQKIWGSKNRRRVRSRVYGRPDGAIPPAAFIEVKHKSYEVGVKRRVAVPLAELPELSVGRIPPSLLDPTRSRSDRQVLWELQDLIIREGARPVVQVRYDRMAYDSGRTGTLRVTFDTGLRCRFDLKTLKPDDRDFPLPVVEEDIAVVEIKTIGPVPVWLREAAGTFQLHSRSMSKYCNALERFDPAVAANPANARLVPT